jgi:hypothetical protein
LMIVFGRATLFTMKKFSLSGGKDDVR